MGTSESWGETCDGLAFCPGRIEMIFSCLSPMKPDVRTDLMSHIGAGQSRLFTTLQQCNRCNHRIGIQNIIWVLPSHTLVY